MKQEDTNCFDEYGDSGVYYSEEEEEVENHDIKLEWKERKRIHLQFLHHIRLKINENLKNTPHYDILDSFPIVELKGELKKYENTGCLQYLGYCDSKHSDYVHINDTLQQSRNNKTFRIRIALSYLSDHHHHQKKKHLIPIELLLPTFLHELSHAITPGVLEYRFGDLRSANGKNERVKKWHFNAHSSLFYRNFAMILRIAEEMNIYRVPNATRKYSEKTLRRMDMIDVLCTPELCGSSPFSLLSHLPLEPLKCVRDLNFDLNSILMRKCEDDDDDEEEEDGEGEERGGEEDWLEGEGGEENGLWSKRLNASCFFANKKNNMKREANNKQRLQNKKNEKNIPPSSVDDNNNYNYDDQNDYDIIITDQRNHHYYNNDNNNNNNQNRAKTRRSSSSSSSSSSPLLKNNVKIENMIMEAVQSIEACKELRLTISNAAGNSKVIVCSRRSMDELFSKAKQKFRHKYSKVFLLPEYVQLCCDDDLKRLRSDSTLLFCF